MRLVLRLPRLVIVPVVAAAVVAACGDMGRNSENAGPSPSPASARPTTPGSDATRRGDPGDGDATTATGPLASTAPSAPPTRVASGTPESAPPGSGGAASPAPAPPGTAPAAAPVDPTAVAPPLAPTPALTCAPPSDVLVTPSGRRVLLRVEGVRPWSPLVLILHGYTGTPSGIERFAEFTEVGNAASIAVAYPEGTPTPTDGFGWSSGAAVFATSGMDDVGALAEMLDAIVATGCVDPSRVVVSGESNGAGMALTAACDLRVGRRIAALVLVNAAVDDGVLARCGSGAPVALALSAVAGEIDATVPYEGGQGLIAQEEWFAAASRLVAGCEVIGERTRVDAWTTVVPASGCETCSVLFAVADGTHTWPGTTRGSGDLRPGTFDLATRVVWAAVAPPPVPCLPW